MWLWNLNTIDKNVLLHNTIARSSRSRVGSSALSNGWGKLKCQLWTINNTFNNSSMRIATPFPARWVHRVRPLHIIKHLLSPQVVHPPTPILKISSEYNSSIAVAIIPGGWFQNLDLNYAAIKKNQFRQRFTIKPFHTCVSSMCSSRLEEVVSRVNTPTRWIASRACRLSFWVEPVLKVYTRFDLLQMWCWHSSARKEQLSVACEIWWSGAHLKIL